MYSKIFLACAVVIGLSACVEIKDPNEVEKADPPIEVSKKSNNLYVEKVVYLWQGKVLSHEQFKKLNFSQSSAEKFEYKFDEVEIAEGAVIYTLGQSAKIEIKRLLSRGRLETFPEGATAASGNGRSGGHVELVITNPSGTLDIFLRGENGAAGEDGVEGKPGKPGERSSDCWGFAKADEIKRTFGGRGTDGTDGKPGGNGGNSGTLNLHIPVTTEFWAAIKKIPGDYGRGGKGKQGGSQGPQAPVCIDKVLKPVPLDPNLKGNDGVDAQDGIRGLPEGWCIFAGGQPACG